MNFSKNNIVFFFILCFGIGIVFFQCDTNNKEENKHQSKFENINGNAKYVGIETCRKCHDDIYKSFIQTGMGQSFGKATKQKSAANFNPAVAHVFDSINNFHYFPFWENDSLFISEMRFENGDTIHNRKEYIKYIIGSGQHTNSHIIDINGYLYQAPITFYAQKGKWDLAPGFEHGKNTRFDRKIELECMSCHNAFPELVEGSFNKYSHVPEGINCERCHGPGSIHVEERLSNPPFDTSKSPDYTIVNPRRLTISQQNNICMRCHLQGITVLNDNCSFYDFKPSLILSDFMTTFLPKYNGQDNKMIMASQVERLMMSQCFIQSQNLSCITCHNPHISVKNTAKQHFNEACKNCHSPSNFCTEKENLRKIKNDDCVTCHMPKNGSIDIPHVAVTDHFIRKKPNIENDDKVSFEGLISYNNPNPSNDIKAKGYMELYERYIQNTYLLDSAKKFISKNNVDEKVHLYYLEENYEALYLMAKEKTPTLINDPWTAYRMGEGAISKEDYNLALSYFSRASDLMPLVTDFKLKKAIALMQSNKIEEGKVLLESLSKETPNYYLIWYNLYIYWKNKNNLIKANEFLNKSIYLQPDLLNKTN